MKRPIRTLAAAAAATALLGSFAVTSAHADGATDKWPTYGETHVLNAAGGSTGSDGMRITFGGGQLTAQRQDDPDEPGYPNNEIYSPSRLPGTENADGVFSQVALAVGDATNGGTAFVSPANLQDTQFAYDYVDDGEEEIYTPLVTRVPWNVTTTSSSDSIVSTLTGEADGLTYTVEVTVTYTSPDDRMKIDYQVIIPAGNTKAVRLYHLIDTYLGGSDAGPGFFNEPVDCGSGAESGAVVGVDRADLGVVEAFQYISGTPWTSYMSGYYSDVVFGNNGATAEEWGQGEHFGPGFGNDLNNQIITDPENDNGIGISWNFGVRPGTYDSAAKLIFSSETVDPCADPEAVSVTNPDPTEVPDPVIDPDVTDPGLDPLKDEPTPEVVAPSFTG
jgi:hypothetical protein